MHAQSARRAFNPLSAALPAVVLALSLGLVACSDPEVQPPADAPEASAPDEVIMPEGSAALALDTEGLRLVNRETGATRLIAFGSGDEEAIAAVAAAIGQPRERNANEECPAGPLSFAAYEGGLSLAFQNNSFVGWSVGQPGTGFATMSGVRVGSSQSELQSAYSATIEQTTLGTEFRAGELAGTLDGPEGRVTNIWSGVNCVFR